MYREYCYDFDYNFYHFNKKKNKLIKITRKEYKEKTGESDFIIKKLRESRWPVQQNDYFFIKSGKHFWPIDYKLFGLIKFFSSKRIITVSSHQGKYISTILMVNIKDIDKTKEIFGAENVKVFPKREIIIGRDNDLEDEIEDEERKKEESDRYHDKIRIYQDELVYTNGNKPHNSFFISFNTNMIDKMYKKLRLEIPKHSEAHKGRRIIHPGRLEKLLN